MPQPTASQNSVSNNTSDWSGSTASLFTRIRLFFSATGVALGITRHDPSQQQSDDNSSITSSELDDRDSNLQIDRNQQNPFDGYSTSSSARSSIRSYGSYSSSSTPGQQEGEHNITENANAHDSRVDTCPNDVEGNLQIELIQQHPFDGYSPASSTRSSIRSYGSGTSSSPVEQEVIQSNTEYNDHDTTFTTGHNGINNRVYGERRTIRSHNQPQKNENQNNNGNPVLPSATVMAGFTGGVRVISDRNGNLAFNVLRLSVCRDGRTVYETASVFSDIFNRLICSLTPEPLKRTAKSVMNRRRLIINACYLILANSCQYMICYAVYIEDIQLSRLSSLGVGFAVSALYLRKVIYSISNLDRQWHIVERREFYSEPVCQSVHCFSASPLILPQHYTCIGQSRCISPYFNLFEYICAAPNSFLVVIYITSSSSV